MEAIWKSNPEVRLLYCFEDRNCFVKHGDAASHAKTTGLKYTTVERPKEEEEKQPTKTKK